MSCEFWHISIHSDCTWLRSPTEHVKRVGGVPSRLFRRRLIRHEGDIVVLLSRWERAGVEMSRYLKVIERKHVVNTNKNINSNAPPMK